MKHLFLFFTVFNGSFLSGYSAKAQQAKAYDIVHYVAQVNKSVFQLNYADGYTGASNIKLRHNGQKALVFLPISGTTEINGDLKFSPPQSSGTANITLTHINEQESAPAIIHGIYRQRGNSTC